MRGVSVAGEYFLFVQIPIVQNVPHRNDIRLPHNAESRTQPARRTPRRPRENSVT